MTTWLERIVPGFLVVGLVPAQLPAQGLRAGSRLSAALGSGWLLAILGVAGLFLLIRFLLRWRRSQRELPIPLIVDLEALAASAAAANAQQRSRRVQPAAPPPSTPSPIHAEALEPAVSSKPRETSHPAPLATQAPSPPAWREDDRAALPAMHPVAMPHGVAPPTEQPRRIAAALNGGPGQLSEAPLVRVPPVAEAVMSPPVPLPGPAAPAPPAPRPVAPQPIPTAVPATRFTGVGEKLNGNGSSSRGLALGGEAPRQPVADLPTIVLHGSTEQPLQLLPGTLEILEGAEGPSPIHFFRTAALELPEVTLGRAHGPAYRHIQLQAPSVSRIHACMRFEAGHWKILNLSRTNPLRVNGLVLDAPEVGCTLKDGDRLQLGEVVLRYREQRA